MDESLSTQLKTTDYAHSALILRALGVQLCARFQFIRVQKLPPKSVDGLISPSGHAQNFQPTYDFDRKQALAYAIHGDVIIVESLSMSGVSLDIVNTFSLVSCSLKTVIMHADNVRCHEFNCRFQ
jgi:hypothetical protein